MHSFILESACYVIWAFILAVMTNGLCFIAFRLWMGRSYEIMPGQYKFVGSNHVLWRGVVILSSCGILMMMMMMMMINDDNDDDSGASAHRKREKREREGRKADERRKKMRRKGRRGGEKFLNDVPPFPLALLCETFSYALLLL